MSILALPDLGVSCGAQLLQVILQVSAGNFVGLGQLFVETLDLLLEQLGVLAL